MFKNSSIKINSITNKYHMDDVTFLPNHKYSFVYNYKYYIGFFKKVLEKHDKQMYIFNNFSIESNLNEPSYIFDFQHYKLSPNIARLLEHKNTFSDSDSDSDSDGIYNHCLHNGIFDDFHVVDI